MLKLLIIFLGIEISHDDLSFPTELKAKHLITASFLLENTNWKVSNSYFADNQSKHLIFN